MHRNNETYHCHTTFQLRPPLQSQSETRRIFISIFVITRLHCILPKCDSLSCLFDQKVTAKFLNYKSRYYDKSRKYRKIIADAVMKVSIEKSRYNDNSHYYD